MENTLLLEILSDHLHGQKTTLPDGVDWPALALQARMHQVDGIVYKQCACPPVASLAQGYSAAAFYYANRTRAMEKIANAFRTAGVPFFSVKGLQVAKYYPVPALRTMGDCDIITAPGCMSDAVGVMRALGYTGKETYEHEWCCDANGLHFEVHDLLVEHGEDTSDRQRDFFNNYMTYVHDGALDRNFHFLYLLMHMKKHFKESGAGIRHFFDLAVVIQNDTELDWTWIEDQLARLHMDAFARVCYALIENWFAVTPPVSFEKPDEAFLQDVTERVLRGGLFGYFDEALEANADRDTMNRGKGPLWLRRFIAFWRFVFLPYSAMAQYPGISYLAGKPWLLPVAWLHRLILVVTRKDKADTRKTFDLILIAKSELEERKEYLKKMGMDR